MAIFDFRRSTSREIEILRHDVALFKHLIKERHHPLDLVRELLSNAGSVEVGASRIEISYTKDKDGHVFEVADDGRKIEGRRVDIDSAIVRKLRRGEYLLDGSIDLHGLDATTARDKLEAFLKLSRSRGERTLLVIHGRGKNSPGGRAILRGEIVSWLSQGHESALVSAFSTALPDDGGDGAMYVRLR